MRKSNMERVNYGVPFEDATKAMARETILISLADLQEFSQRTDGHHELQDVLKWFNDRHTVAFGYGWCLEQSGMNPNDIRIGINKILKSARCL